MGKKHAGIKHVVVVMLENRSYDNILGGLYLGGNTPPAGQSDLEGLTGAESNELSTGHQSSTYTVANQTKDTSTGALLSPSYPATCIPLVDPGEIFADMSQQILNWTKEPSSNPYTSYSRDTPGLMAGFVNNYYDPVGAVGASNLQDVMNYFSALQLPVTAFLARYYAVCDDWYSSVPTQTFTNRVFALCAAPAIGIEEASFEQKIYSWVDDIQYLNAKANYELPSLLSVLDAVMPNRSDAPAPPYWKVYFHDYSIAMNTLPYVASVAETNVNGNVFTFDNSDWGIDSSGVANLPPGVGEATTTFLEDAASGNLPMFSFVEPRYSNNTANVSLPPNSNHPGASNFGFFTATVGVTNDNPPIDVCSGEYFLMQVYNALRNGPAWDETLLIVTYDEPGGTYDSKPPHPAAAPASFNLPWPSKSQPPSFWPNIPAAEDAASKPPYGFGFDVLGGRVPALVISRYTNAGSRIHHHHHDGRHFDHTSIIRTVWDLFDLSSDAGASSLTARDAAAASLLHDLETDAVNTTGPFGGVILTSPGSFMFDGTGSQLLLAATGDDASLTLTAAVKQLNDDKQPWLTVTPVTDASLPNAWTISASSDHFIVPGLKDGTLTISATGYDDVTIPVTMLTA